MLKNFNLLVEDGKVKPVCNITNGSFYNSLSESSRIEKISISLIKKSCETGLRLKNMCRYAYFINGELDLKEGHFIQSWDKPFQIKELTTGMVFNNVKDASVYFGVTPQHIYQLARGKFSTLHHKYALCYLDENGKEILTDNHLDTLKKLSEKNMYKYAVWHIDESVDNHIKYKSISEMPHVKTRHHVRSVCMGERNHINNFRIAYLDENGSPILTPKHMSNNCRVVKRVICLNDGAVFENAHQASKHYGINDESISKCAYGKLKSCYVPNQGRLQFAFLDENDRPTRGLVNLDVKYQNSFLVSGYGHVNHKCRSIADLIRFTKLSGRRVRKYLSDPTTNVGHWKIERI